MNYSLPKLPPSAELESKYVLKQLARSHRALAELKGFSGRIPNNNIFIKSLFYKAIKSNKKGVWLYGGNHNKRQTKP